jgi:peptidoglycan/LPS O-acetylase OafA/YrhL
VARARGLVETSRSPSIAARPTANPAAVMSVLAHSPESFAPALGQMTYPLYLTHSIVGAFLIREAVTAGLNRWLALIERPRPRKAAFTEI